MTLRTKFEVAIIGAGPAGLMAAERLARGGARVTVFEKMPSAGRKFLMAGRGGLNLTHSEPLDKFLSRYGDAMPRLKPIIEAFSPQALRAWCKALGQETFIGSSGRVFPTGMKASPLLRAWLRELAQLGVELKLRHAWRDWRAISTGSEVGRIELALDAADGAQHVCVDAVVLALGGGSWAKLGSDGGWMNIVAAHGIRTAPLRPSNCGFLVDWSETFRERFEGQPLKSVVLMHDAARASGDIIITKSGIEGGAVYPLSASLREAIEQSRSAVLNVALRPDVETEVLAKRLAAPRDKKSFSNFLRKAIGLSPAAIGLLQEAAISMGQKLVQMEPAELAALINAVPVRLSGTAPVDRAISTAGGVCLDEIDELFMLRRCPGIFIAGEMLDWEAPTGGYLLQASFATGYAAGEGTLQWLRANPPR